MPTTVSESATLQRELWNAAEFLDWLQPGVHADLIDGERFMHSPVNLKHADLINVLDHLLRAYVEAKKLGKVYRAGGGRATRLAQCIPPRPPFCSRASFLISDR